MPSITLPRRFSALLALASAAAVAHAEGPDLIVADAYSAVKWGAIGDTSAYSFSYIYCNLGDERAVVLQNIPPHPVITANVYRIKGGRLEHIAQGFGFHEYCALQSATCQTCNPVQTSCTALGPGCSTTTGSSTAGAQQRLASRRFVNPATGEIAWPIPGFGGTGDTLFKRVQVFNGDLDPALNVGASYFVESIIVAIDDAYYSRNLNNATCRPFTVGPYYEGGYHIALAGSPQREKTAIDHWAALDPSVVVSVVSLADPRERFILGCKATDLGNGTWRYTYALQNYSSVQGAGSFAVPLAGASASALGFHDVNYHSGDPFDPADWSAGVGSSVVWTSPQTWAENPDSNALRWGTTYTFTFEADTAPTTGEAIIGLFAPGDQAEVSIAATVPSPTLCLGDADGDRIVNFSDVTAALARWGTIYPGPTGFGDADHDGFVGFSDITAALAQWGGVCPA